MKVKDILKHSSATLTRIIDNSDKYEFLCWGVLDYMQNEPIIQHGSYSSYSAKCYLPKDVLNKEVDFISPESSISINIYTK